MNDQSRVTDGGDSFFFGLPLGPKFVIVRVPKDKGVEPNVRIFKDRKGWEEAFASHPSDVPVDAETKIKVESQALAILEVFEL